MADDLPLQPVLQQSPNLSNPNVVPEGKTEATASQIGNAFMSTAGAQVVERGVDMGYAAMRGGDQIVDHDKAVALLKAQNYDSSGVPKTGWSESALTTEMIRQQRAQDASLAASRANLSSTTQFVSNLAGGLGDPITLAAGPLLGRTTGAIEAGAAGRAAIGAAEGGGLIGSEEALQNHLQGHDEDTLSWATLRDITLSAAPGALLHSAFGTQRMVVPKNDMRGEAGLGVIDKLERSDAAAKIQGVDVDHVVSPTGAVGRYQIEPATARGLGLKGTDAEISEQLKDPAVNKDMGSKLLDQLARRYGNDPEAIATAYNAGPHAADRWIAAGRDDKILPHETQDYLARLRGTPYQARVDAAKLSLSQLDSDSPVEVKPVSNFPDQYSTNPFRIRDEHDAQVEQLHTEAMRDALPMRDRQFQLDRQPYDMRHEFAPQETVAKPGPTLPADEIVHYQNAQSAAAERVAGLGPEAQEVYKNELAEQEATPEVGSLKHDEVTKGVQAAVQCGVMKGLTYGAD